MKIEDTMPIILTKDLDFLDSIKSFRLRPGEVILLPEDAILVKSKEDED